MIKVGNLVLNVNNSRFQKKLQVNLGKGGKSRTSVVVSDSSDQVPTHRAKQEQHMVTCAPVQVLDRGGYGILRTGKVD